jgi:hypothetical protein
VLRTAKGDIVAVTARELLRSRSASCTGKKPTRAGIEKHGSGDPLGSKKAVVLKIIDV